MVETSVVMSAPAGAAVPTIAAATTVANTPAKDDFLMNVETPPGRAEFLDYLKRA
jgi:hypothetical protein